MTKGPPKGSKRLKGVKIAITKKYVSTDGTEFATAEEAAAHSNIGDGENFLKQFVMWRPERVQAASDADTDKGKRDAAAIEAWAKRLYAQRVARGEVRKRAPNKAKEETAPPAPPADAPAEGAPQNEGDPNRVAA